MTTPSTVDFHDQSSVELADLTGTIVVFADGDGALIGAAAEVDRLTGGALSRAVGDADYKASPKRPTRLAFPSGVAADQVIVASLGKTPDREAARLCGGTLSSGVKGKVALCTAGVADNDLIAEMIFAAVVRQYRFTDYKKDNDEEERMIHYENATFDVFGVSIAWLPYFRHPDPTVKRASGFLVPEFLSSTTFGYAGTG